MVLSKKFVKIMMFSVAASGVLLLVFLVPTFFFHLVAKSLNEEVVYPARSYEYQSLSLSSSNEYSYGSVSTFDEIEEGSYQYYVNEDGSHMLISPFGSEEYHCTGICYCENGHDLNRRIAAGAVQRSMTYLLAAVTSGVAFQLASNYFQEVCDNQLSDECGMSSVRSEVSNCVNMEVSGDGGSGSSAKAPPKVPPPILGEVVPEDAPAPSTDAKEVSKEEEEVAPEVDTKHKVYMCKGHCYPYAEDQTSEDLRKEFMDEKTGLVRQDSILSKHGSLQFIFSRLFECINLYMNGITVTIPLEEEGKEDVATTNAKEDNQRAKEKFLVDHLDGFCSQYSSLGSEDGAMKEVEDAYAWLGNEEAIQKEWTEGQKREYASMPEILGKLFMDRKQDQNVYPLSWCTSRLFGEGGPTPLGKLKNINCRKVPGN